jgi:EAL domain-containing protein (putative c-di-GMP-specific phosphodiesterase class I)
MQKVATAGCAECLESDSPILEKIDVITHFQPIISVTKSAVIGFESLCRGRCKQCGRLIPPFELFGKLKDENELFTLDLKAREVAIKQFDRALADNSELLLFLNFDANLIEQRIDSPDTILAFCEGTNVKPHNLVIEVTESKPCNIERLVEFVDSSRKAGFLIALDDVGTGYSNFDRISAIKPDIIKLDRSIIENLDKDYHKKVIFRSMTRLAGKIGILLLAEGVEKEEEVTYSLELGADLLQGFYFARPGELNNKLTEPLKNKISHMESRYRDFKIERIRDLREKHKMYADVMDEISNNLNNTTEENFDDLLAKYVDTQDFIESLYVLNSDGVQITHSHLNSILCLVKPKIYKIFKKGDIHYYKEYFYLLWERVLDKFTTDTYFSHITGGLCKTISLRFRSRDEKDYVLCMNIRE